MNAFLQLVELRKNLLNLQMQYVVHLMLHEGKSFDEAMSCSEVRYFTVGFKETDGKMEVWKGLLSRAQSLFELEGPERFPEMSWGRLWAEPVGIKARMDLDNEKEVIASSFAGFTFEYHGEYFKQDQPQLLTLHFRNAFRPETPFRHISELKEGLRQIVNVVRKQRQDITRVQCASWLNNVPAFVSLFPESWLKDSKVVPVEGNSGWWGQFVDRDGNFNYKRADEFSKTWEFDWPNRMCICDIAEICEAISV